MENQLLQHKIAITLLYGIGPVKANNMISKLGGIEPVFTEKLSSIHKASGIGMDVLKNMKREAAFKEAEKHVQFIEKNKITSHFIFDSNYPRRLRQCPDAPLLLYSLGNFKPNPTKSVAIVGTRNATEYGKSICEELISNFRDNDIQVVSGMAYGIDICAHQNCLKHDIETVGVLGHGLDRIYPSRHKRTAIQILENGGLLTEFLPGTNPDKENFPMRNRIVAGMCDATIVVESKLSGGSLITAELANDYNRDVFAFPGNIGQHYSAGCNALIQNHKAQLISSAKDFLRIMSWENKPLKGAQQSSLLLDLNDEEMAIMEALSYSAHHIDTLAIKLKSPVSKMSVLLLTMELKGIIKSLPGNKYSKIN